VTFYHRDSFDAQVNVREGTTCGAVTVARDIDQLVEVVDSVGGPRQRAADALAAAEWLETHGLR
jgi:hypothetical protein